jgi:hypothetical protein
LSVLKRAKGRLSRGTMKVTEYSTIGFRGKTLVDGTFVDERDAQFRFPEYSQILNLMLILNSHPPDIR